MSDIAQGGSNLPSRRGDSFVAEAVMVHGTIID